MKSRVVWGTVLALLFAGILTLTFDIQLAKSEPTTMIVPDDYEKIQWAIGNASIGDTIFVRAGTYYEHVIIDKSLRLIGEYDGTNITTLHPQHHTFTYWDYVVKVTADNVEISQFKIRGSHGIIINCSSNNIIIDNIIHNKYNGLNLVSSNNNIITGNTIYSNYPGVELTKCANNTIFHNNFIENQGQINVHNLTSTSWDNGEEGNYWSNYQGLDSNGDGIGDTPALIASEFAPYTTIRDIYPLMVPWNPQGLLSSLLISCNPSTTFAGFRVNINGRLTYVNGSAISGPRIILSYSTTNGESWNDITSVSAESDGKYSAQWIAPATGAFIVKSAWAGDISHGIWRASAKVNLSIIPFEETYIFSVVSNSTISALTFNSTERVLNFGVNGPSGTKGYVEVTVAKDLVENAADVKVYLDGDKLNYTVKSLDDSWLLHFTYLHSTHKVTISLGDLSVPFLETLLGKVVLYGIPITTMVILIIIYILKKRSVNS